MRKRPTQDRSKATVDAILSATERLLRKDGYEGVSTNRIAMTAGVSIGSLYQYFPSKEAVVAAVVDRHTDQVTTLLEQKLLGLLEAPIEVAARALVAEMLAMHRIDPKLHKALIDLAQSSGMGSRIEQMERRFATLLAGYLAAHQHELEVKDCELAAFLVVTAVDAITHSVVTSRPELLESGALMEQMVGMVLGYLAPSRAKKAKRLLGRAPAAQ